MSKAKMTFAMDVKGLDKLKDALLGKAKMEVVQKIVKQNTVALQQRAQQMTGSVYDHPTGATKRGIGIAFRDAGLTGITGMSMEYNPYTENGTRFMRARPVLKPAFLYQKVIFINQLKNAAK